jgi:hypothetical protein
MLENFPISAYAICYGPLAMTIIGFIVFAYFTDKHARRTYLREMDPRPDSERLEDVQSPVVVDRPIRAETPAGVSLKILPPEEKSVAVESPISSD